MVKPEQLNLAGRETVNVAKPGQLSLAGRETVSVAKSGRLLNLAVGRQWLWLNPQSRTLLVGRL